RVTRDNAPACIANAACPRCPRFLRSNLAIHWLKKFTENLFGHETEIAFSLVTSRRSFRSTKPLKRSLFLGHAEFTNLRLREKRLSAHMAH
ncbi:hypothetical protein ALC60_00284, partial [Trachymyrmex zeteki]